MTSGGELLVELMRTLGIDTAFGVISVHNLPLVEAVDRELRFVPVRHEASAVNAADGYGRARGGLGVALTSTGTGSGNAAGSLIESLSAGSAVLHVTGQIPSEHLGSGKGVIHETKDQLGMLTAVSKLACTVTAESDVGRVLSEAAATAMSAPRGPVSIEWPIDLQYTPGPSSLPSRVEPEHPVAPSTEAVSRAVELIGAAKRPLVWAGGGALGAGAALSELLDVIGAGLLTSNSGRGVIREDDPRCIGNYATNPAVADLLGSADLLVSIGTHFRSNETKDYALDLPRPHVQIDIDPAALGRAYPCDLGITGDASLALDAILQSLGAHDGAPGWRQQVEAVRASARDHHRESIGPHAVLNDAVRAAVPEGSVIARDVTIPSSSWGNRLLEIYAPRTNVFPRGGGIGQGLAMGIGAAVADPDHPVVVMVGDGGLAVHLGELLTLAQERPWVIVLLFNDRGYGVLRNMQDQHSGRRSGVDLHTPDFAQLCVSMGLSHRCVTDAAELASTLTAAVAEGGPAVVEVDVDAVGPMPRPFIPPVPIPEA